MAPHGWAADGSFEGFAGSAGQPRHQFVPLDAMIPVVLLGLYLVVASVMLKRQEAMQRERPRTLSDLLRSVGHACGREVGLDLLERETFTFVSVSYLERRLDHRIEDADGGKIGSALQQPRPGRFASDNGRPSRFSTVRVEISDQWGANRLVVVRPAALRLAALTVLDGNGATIGTVGKERSGRFPLTDASGVRIGTIERKTKAAWLTDEVDYAVQDAAGVQVATISDFRHIVRRFPSAISADTRRLRKLLGRGQPDEHVLEISAPVTREFRILVLGAAAAVYLVLQYPFVGDA